MVDSRKIRFRIGFHRWSWLFLALAFIFALPALLIIFNPLFHAAGIEWLYSAGGHMASTTDSQKGAMASTAAAAAAAAAVAPGRSQRSSRNTDDEGSDSSDSYDPDRGGDSEDEQNWKPFSNKGDDKPLNFGNKDSGNKESLSEQSSRVGGDGEDDQNGRSADNKDDGKPLNFGNQNKTDKGPGNPYKTYSEGSDDGDEG